MTDQKPEVGLPAPSRRGARDESWERYVGEALGMLQSVERGADGGLGSDWSQHLGGFALTYGWSQEDVPEVAELVTTPPPESAGGKLTPLGVRQFNYWANQMHPKWRLKILAAPVAEDGTVGEEAQLVVDLAEAHLHDLGRRLFLHPWWRWAHGLDSGIGEPEDAAYKKRVEREKRLARKDLADPPSGMVPPPGMRPPGAVPFGF